MSSSLQVKELLSLIDSSDVWNSAAITSLPQDLSSAYRLAIELGIARASRGEKPLGAKIGFTNRAMWKKIDASAPIWGYVWDSTCFKLGLSGSNCAKISAFCQPRIEPEIAFRLSAPVRSSMSRGEIFDCLVSIAPAFEIVQCHARDWELSAPFAISDAGLHGQLWLGEEFPIRNFCSSSIDLERNLSSSKVVMSCHEGGSYAGSGFNVLGNPFEAFCQFLSVLEGHGIELPLDNNFVITTGSWTDAPPIRVGQEWQASFTCFDSPIKLLMTE